ncbi:hypothetical protein Salat_0224300 [Sesamum alatum]|uniref:Uncharacterized protein n=1 Tax=Sesamum alatum TaxID=300844 RepID=A0AAE1YZ19_9LAMI|nr:hypothetical protein Salat_0224300 [Sesamum alatum]
MKLRSVSCSEKPYKKEEGRHAAGDPRLTEKESGLHKRQARNQNINTNTNDDRDRQERRRLQPKTEVTTMAGKKYERTTQKTKKRKRETLKYPKSAIRRRPSPTSVMPCAVHGRRKDLIGTEPPVDTPSTTDS